MSAYMVLRTLPLGKGRIWQTIIHFPRGRDHDGDTQARFPCGGAGASLATGEGSRGAECGGKNLWDVGRWMGEIYVICLRHIPDDRG